MPAGDFYFIQLTGGEYRGYVEDLHNRYFAHTLTTLEASYDAELNRVIRKSIETRAITRTSADTELRLPSDVGGYQVRILKSSPSDEVISETLVRVSVREGSDSLEFGRRVHEQALRHLADGRYDLMAEESESPMHVEIIRQY